MNRCNHAGVGRKRGQKGTSAVCTLARAPGKAAAAVSASARDGRQTDRQTAGPTPASATLPRGRSRMRGEEAVRAENLTAASVKNASAHWPRRLCCNRV